jgi:hypothetical protein
MIYAIDFDGTIVDDNFPDVGKLKPGAKRVINKLKQAGHTLILWTCRNGQHLQEAKDFLKKEDLEFDYFNESTPDIKKQGFGEPKIFYDVLIDDRNIGGFPGWSYVEIKLL